MSSDWVNEQRRRLADSQSQLDALNAKAAITGSGPAAGNEVTVKANEEWNMSGTAKVLSWFALISTVLFVVFAVGRHLAPELLAFPLAATAAAQLLILHCKGNSTAVPNMPQPQGASPLGRAGPGNMAD
jgi:hypothetical protein